MQNFLKKKITRSTLEPFIASHGSEEFTLDVGCAAKAPYAKYFPNRIGYDVEPGKGVDVVGDAHILPFEDDYFDNILCTEVLEHLHTPTQAIDEMRRVLKPGGTLILTTRFTFPLHDTPHDFFRYTKYGLKHLFRDWSIEEFKEETHTMQTFAVLLQTISNEVDFRGGKFTKFLFLITAKIVPYFSFLIKKEFSDRRTKNTIEETAVLSSGYYMVCKNKK